MLAPSILDGALIIHLLICMQVAPTFSVRASAGSRAADPARSAGWEPEPDNTRSYERLVRKHDGCCLASFCGSYGQFESPNPAFEGQDYVFIN